MAAVAAARPLPAFRGGDHLEVTVRVPEAGGKTYVYRGVCIARVNKALRSSFTIYNVFPEAGGLLQTFPLYSPDVLAVRVVGRLARPRPTVKHYYLLGDGYREAAMLQSNIEPPK